MQIDSICACKRGDSVCVIPVRPRCRRIKSTAARDRRARWNATVGNKTGTRYHSSGHWMGVQSGTWYCLSVASEVRFWRACHMRVHTYIARHALQNSPRYASTRASLDSPVALRQRPQRPIVIQEPTAVRRFWRNQLRSKSPRQHSAAQAALQHGIPETLLSARPHFL